MWGTFQYWVSPTNFFALTWQSAPAFAANSFLALPESAYLHACPSAPLARRTPSGPPKLGEGATSLPPTFLGGVSEIRRCQTPSSAWAWRCPFIPFALPCRVLTSRCACVAGRYPWPVAYEASPHFSMSYSCASRIPADRMGDSQLVSMQETGDAGRVGRTPHLLSRTLGSNGAHPGMVRALLWTPLLCGEQTDRRPGAPTGPRNAQPGWSVSLREEGQRCSWRTGEGRRISSFLVPHHCCWSGFHSKLWLFAGISIRFGLMPR